MIDRAFVEKHFLTCAPAFIAVPDDGTIGLVAADAVKDEPDYLDTFRNDLQFIIAQIPDAETMAAITEFSAVPLVPERDNAVGSLLLQIFVKDLILDHGDELLVEFRQVYASSLDL